MDSKILLWLTILIILYTSLPLFFFKKVTNSIHYPERVLYYKLKKYDLYPGEQFEKVATEDVEITSIDDLKLRGTYIPYLDQKGNECSDNTIILVHGYTTSSVFMMQYIDTFQEHGWNILLIDQRGHGKSEGKYASYGRYEKYDLDSWVDWVVKRNGKDSVIGLLGVSMGAATVLQYAQINNYVDFIIADCGYSDMEELLKYQFDVRDIRVQPYYDRINYLLNKRLGFYAEEVSPIKAIADQEVPIMFIHGSEDDFVPTYMSEEMYKIKPGVKKILIIEGAEHAEAYVINKQLYEKEMWLFIDSVLANR
ncbi:MAG TPA: alpha/beta hydrolase [Firmicutes bacterium]|nr:alpha/beta hydrolase [Bacillota bacterium]